MNLVKEAIDLGFSNAAVMDTKKLVFVPEYRIFCEENRCGCYNLNPACPPSCGTAEEMKQRAPVGRIYPGKRKVLGEKSFFDQKQTFQSF